MTDTTIGNGSGTYNVTGSQGGTITVGNGNNTLNLTGGSDQTIAIGGGKDTVTVTGATGDTITAGSGTDSITVTSGSDNTITVGNGNETVVASGDFSDSISLGMGNDTVYLGADDTLHMGKGSELVILPPSTPVLATNPITVTEDQTISLASLGLSASISAFGFGYENIYGFAAADQLEFTTAQFANFQAVMAAATQVGQNTVITDTAGDTITLENVAKSTLAAKNFVFVNAASSSGNLLVTMSGLPSDLSNFNGGTYTANAGTWSGTEAQFNALTFSAGEETSAQVTVTATDTTTGYSIFQSVALVITPPTINIAVNGAAQEGQTLTAVVTVSNGDAFTYQWQSSSDGTNWANIANATGMNYLVQEGDETQQLRVKITLVDDGYSVTSAATAAVLDAAQPTRFVYAYDTLTLNSNAIAQSSTLSVQTYDATLNALVSAPVDSVSTSGSQAAGRTRTASIGSVSLWTHADGSFDVFWSENFTITNFVPQAVPAGFERFNYERSYGADGQPEGDAQLVGHLTGSSTSPTTVVADAADGGNGGFVYAYDTLTLNSNAIAQSSTLSVQTYDATLNALVSAPVDSVSTSGSQAAGRTRTASIGSVSLSTHADGSFDVFWSENFTITNFVPQAVPAGFERFNYERSYGADGQPEGDAQLVGHLTGSSTSPTTVVADAADGGNGGFVYAYDTLTLNSNAIAQSSTLSVQTYDATLNALVSAPVDSVSTSGSQAAGQTRTASIGSVSLSTHADGSFDVFWSENFTITNFVPQAVPAGFERFNYERSYGADGQPEGDAQLVGHLTGSSTSPTTVVADAASILAGASVPVVDAGGSIALNTQLPAVTVADGATLEIGSATASAVTFASNSGTLQLDASQSFTGTITGFGGQDQIDLADIAFSASTTLGYTGNADNSGATLNVSDGTHTANIALLGSYMASSFVAASDGHGGTLISEAAQGTNQRPDRGAAACVIRAAYHVNVTQIGLRSEDESAMHHSVLLGSETLAATPFVAAQFDNHSKGRFGS